MNKFLMAYFLLLFCSLKKCSSFKIDNPLLMFPPYIAKYLVMPYMPMNYPSTMGLHYKLHTAVTCIQHIFQLMFSCLEISHESMFLWG